MLRASERHTILDAFSEVLESTANLAKLRTYADELWEETAGQCRSTAEEKAKLLAAPQMNASGSMVLCWTNFLAPDNAIDISQAARPTPA